MNITRAIFLTFLVGTILPELASSSTNSTRKLFPGHFLSRVVSSPWEPLTLRNTWHGSSLVISLALILLVAFAGFCLLIGAAGIVAAITRRQAYAKPKNEYIASLAAMSGLVAIVVMSATGILKMPAWLCFYLPFTLLMNLVSLGFMAMDRLAAEHNEDLDESDPGREDRVSEAFLNFLAGCGGILGYHLGIYLFNHKSSTRKPEFRRQGGLFALEHFTVVTLVVLLLSCDLYQKFIRICYFLDSHSDGI